MNFLFYLVKETFGVGTFVGAFISISFGKMLTDWYVKYLARYKVF